METTSILFIRLRRLEHSLVHIRVELFGCLTWVEPLKTVFLEGVDQDAVGHLDAIVKGNQVCIAVRGIELLGRNGAKGAVEVVN
jgi:hypothetical protein